MNSTSWKVCKVASAAKDTRRLANDLRRVSRRSRSSLSRAAACCSSSVLRATLEALLSSVSDLLFVVDRSDVVEPEDRALLELSSGISGNGLMVGFRIERGALVGAANDCQDMLVYL